VRLPACVIVACALLLAGCGSYQRVELVNSTPDAVSVSVVSAQQWDDAEPRADVAAGGRYRYVSSGGKHGVSEVRVTPRAPGLVEARLAVTSGRFRGWIRQSGGMLVIEQAGDEMPPW
jgi:hypothetical protein